MIYFSYFFLSGIMFLKAFKNYFLHLFPFIAVFIGSLFYPIDADLGWHLKYGEYFFKKGEILRDNVFSIMMPDYHWVNHSWASDFLSYFTYINLNFFGITILGALVITLTFFFFSKTAKLSVWNKVLIFPFLIYLLGPVNSASFRAQLISLLFIGILFFILSKYTYNKKYLYCLPPLFLIWANLHGEFILGLGLLFLWVAITLAAGFLIEKKQFLIKEGKFLLAVFIICFFSSSLNPFGFGVFKEAFNHFGNPASKYILEWISFEDLSNSWWNQILVANLMVVGIIYLFFSKKIKENLPFIIITVLVFALSFWERRYAWPAYYLSVFFIKPVSDFFKPNSKKYTDIFSFIILAVTFFGIVLNKLPFEYQSMSWSVYCKKNNFCSPKALDFLSTYKHKGNLLTPYNWGGFMIWNYPQIKPTLDGRMPFWRDQNGYSGFLDYYDFEQNWKDIDKSKYDVVLMSNNKPLYKRLVKLARIGKWKMIYVDKYSGIFIRNQKAIYR